jgi:hypothetical protein
MCGIPLSAEMVREIMQFSHQSVLAGDSDIIVEKSIRANFLGARPLGDTKALYPSITDYLNFIRQADEYARFFSVRPLQEKFWDVAGRRMVRLLAVFLMVKVASMDETLFARALTFANQLNEEDIIISFNWDLLLETALNHSIRFHNGLHMNQHEYGLLKLSGSIDWISAPESEKLIPFTTSELGSGLVRVCGFYNYRKETAKIRTSYPWDFYKRDPVLVVPPTHLSSLESNYIKNLWRRAFEELKDANKIIYAGYQMAESEYFARMMFQANYYRYHFNRMFGANTRIEIYNPDPTVERNYRLLLGDSDEIKYHCVGFEDSPYCQARHADI